MDQIFGPIYLDDPNFCCDYEYWNADQKYKCVLWQTDFLRDQDMEIFEFDFFSAFLFTHKEYEIEPEEEIPEPPKETPTDPDPEPEPEEEGNGLWWKLMIMAATVPAMIVDVSVHLGFLGYSQGVHFWNLIAYNDPNDIWTGDPDDQRNYDFE